MSNSMEICLRQMLSMNKKKREEKKIMNVNW